LFGAAGSGVVGDQKAGAIAAAVAASVCQRHAVVGFFFFPTDQAALRIVFDPATTPLVGQCGVAHLHANSDAAAILEQAVGGKRIVVVV